MLNRNSGVTVRDAESIGVGIAKGKGLYANEIMNARDKMETEYGNIISKANLSFATMKEALGACDGYTVYMNRKYANESMNEAMKVAEKQGFHPKLNGKSGIEAVTAHEMGHFLVEQSGTSAQTIVERAGKAIGVKRNNVASGISEYARYNYDETVAEAVCDFYCNGRKANKGSIAICNEIKRILKK